EEEVVEEGLETFDDKEEDLVARPPIITVMGHVDHGKTSLLDAIRKTSVTTTESGGITQHIGASEVTINGQKIVFLDTPGHEAFTTMRARGAHVTDIAVLVVAADDGVMPQTVESISHAKAAGVPIIVAINKMDKPDANPERVKQELTEHGILVEDWGGDTISVPVSAKSGEGIVTLLEMILLQAEVLELKANPNRLAMGTVIEARLDKNKGPVATLLVLNGTLQAGMSVVAGTSCGRIRAMTNFKGGNIKKAGPATAVEITGLTEVPEAGDEFHATKDDRLAREIAEQRRIKVREEVMQRNSSITLEQLFSQIQEGEVKELNLIVKADVMGSVGALIQSLEKLQNENVKVRIIHSGVGTVTESDIMLASTSNAIIIGFNIRPSTNITALADREKVEIRTYRVIYEIINEIEAALKGMLDPIFKEVVLGKAEIRNTFKVPGAGMVAGVYILEGKMIRNAEMRLVRDGIVIHEGKISSLRRFKEDAKEVAQGYECGVGIDNFNDVKENDIIEAFKMEEIERK
ncbi:MAG: translation initiation factor IF-2, partial [Eubacteriales bacterium]|nr:translation initiation factor IF-2 [Eubacteriales bacterium]